MLVKSDYCGETEVLDAAVALVGTSAGLCWLRKASTRFRKSTAFAGFAKP
jgi:hypothetical protein